MNDLIKYIITSGNSVVTELLEDSVKVVNEPNPLYFDTIGDAIRAADRVNKMLGSACFKVAPVDLSLSSFPI